MGSVDKSIADRLSVQFLEMRVLLTNSNEDDRLASSVYHVECSSNLFIHGVKLGHDDAINALRVD
jgi:hypothetical protein